MEVLNAVGDEDLGTREDDHANQAESMWAYASSALKKAPAKLLGPVELQAKIDQIRAADEELAKRSQAVASGPPAGDAQQAALEKEGQNDSDDDDEELQPINLFEDISRAAGTAKSPVKGKGQGKRGRAKKAEKGPKLIAKARPRQISHGGLGAAVAPLPASSSAGPEEAKSRSRSPRSGITALTQGTVKTKASPKEKLNTQRDKYIKDLDYSSFLNGKAAGGIINCAKRVSKALLASSPGSADGVILEAHIELAEVAQELAVKDLPKLTEEARNEKLQKLFPHLSSIPEPVCLCLGA